MSDPYLGEIRVFAGNYAPEGWSLCDGSTLRIAGNEALFALLGTTYGGDGRTTFGLPDLRGRIAISKGQGAGGPIAYAVGQSGGAETVTLTVDNLPGHTHGLMAATTAATTGNPIGNILADPADTINLYIPADTSATAKWLPLADGAIGNIGGGAAHENRMPTTAITYIIATQGIFPNFNN